MAPKSYYVVKWTVYALATALLACLQGLIGNHLAVFGLYAFLYPILPAVLASYEGSYQGGIFALFYGLLCDVLVPVPFRGMYTIAFTAAALLAGRIGENLIRPGFLCSLTVAALSLAITAGLRFLTVFLSGGGYYLLMGRIALGEALLTMPYLLIVFPVYRLIHSRCITEY